MTQTITLRLGDSFELIQEIAGVGGIVTDPPYGLEFMGKEWDKLTRNIMNPTSEADIERKERYGDNFQGRLSNLPDLGALGKRKPSGFRRADNEADVGRDNVFGRTSRTSPEYESYAQEMQAWHRAWLQLCFDKLPSGGIAKVFSATRTFHRLAAAMEEVGFVDLNLEAWAYGSGFPKSLNVSKAIDKHLGKSDEREVVGTVTHVQGGGSSYQLRMGDRREVDTPITSSATPEARRFDGWGTALKPAWEPFIVGRKP